MASIKRRGFISAASGLDDDAILEYATEELRSYIPAFLKGIREELLIATVDVSATGAPINAPARATGAAFRTIGWLQSDGNVRFLPRIEPENAGGYAQVSGEPCGYVFQGNGLYLLPRQTSGTIRLAYQQRPGQLVSTDACALVSSLGAGQVTVNNRPTGFGDGSSTSYDFVSGTPNFVAFKLDMDSDSDIAWTTSTSLVFDTLNTIYAAAAVGDYLCLSGETCIPQIPLELFDLLAQATASTIATATGSARASGIKAARDDLEKQLTLILSPRSDGSARPIVSRSRIGRRFIGW